MINTNYTFKNLLAFNVSGFACVAFIVFLTSTQPFYLNEVLDINHNLGNIIGNLGLIDEVLCILSSPLIGTLNDRINTSASRLNGAKIIQFIGFSIISLSLFSYAKLINSLSKMYFVRGVFAIGVTSIMSMIPVLLNELSNSDFEFKKIVFWRRRHHHRESNEMANKNGKYSALIGISTGLGAIFSVSMFLTLPVRLNDNYPNLSNKSSLQLSYLILSILSIIVAIYLLIFLYNSNKSNNQVVNPELQPLLPSTKPNYLQLLHHGIKISSNNSKIQLSFVGSFVARSTTVLTAVFIPLWVYHFYHDSGKCDALDKNNCYDGYIFAAILTGVAQTIGLILSPIWGVLIDHRKVGSTLCLLLASILGLVGCFGICFNSNLDPRNFHTFFFVSLISSLQIGSVITSMSLLSSLQSDTSIGSLSGLYSLCGGLGILILNKVGGLWSDSWILAPFALLGAFNILLTLTSSYNLYK